MRGAVHNVFFLTVYCYDRPKLLAIRCQHLSLCACKSFFFVLTAYSGFSCCAQSERLFGGETKPEILGLFGVFSAYLDSTVCACQNKLNQCCNTPRFKWTLLPPVCCLTPPVSFMRQSLIQQSPCTVLDITL